MNKTFIKALLITVCLTVCMFMAGILLADDESDEYIWEVTGTECKLEFQHTARKEFAEKKGVQIIDAYKHYRISTDQIIFSIGPEINNLWQISALLGLAKLELHCSEGETRRFDSCLLLGIDTEILVAVSEDQKVAAYIGGRFVTFNANHGHVATVIQHMDFVVWDSLDLQWREFTFMGRTVLSISEFTSIFAGIEYSMVDVQEDGIVYGVKRSGNLRESNEMGFSLGIEKKLDEIWSLGSSINFINKTTFTVSLTCRF